MKIQAQTWKNMKNETLYLPLKYEYDLHRVLNKIIRENMKKHEKTWKNIKKHEKHEILVQNR